MNFIFGEFKTQVFLNSDIPNIQEIAHNIGIDPAVVSLNALLIADENTAFIAAKICGGLELPCCVLKSGEENKNWQSVQTILEAAKNANLGRYGVFIAVGGGIIGDMAGFAASIYMRGCRFVLVATTLLCMVDASIGGKTGFDLFGIKNLTGSFYPAENVYLPLAALDSLPEKEWKNGFAELIKTAILAGDEFLKDIEELTTNQHEHSLKFKSACSCNSCGSCGSWLKNSIKRAVLFKGSIVTDDLRESENGRRKLLNLGHTFGHALESVTGFTGVSHGEAVAWGIVRACELGAALGITPRKKARKITDLIKSFGYEYVSPHPLANSAEVLLCAMQNDKKKKRGKLAFIVPDEKSACSVFLETESEYNILSNILNGDINELS